MTANSNNSAIFPRSNWWWLGLALLLLLAAWLYLRGYNVSLPFMVHVDEPNHILSAQHLIDEGSARNPIRYDAYPPGMYRLHYLLLKHLRAPDNHFSSVLPIARLITIAVWMLAFVLIALIGCQMARPLTGLMAAAIYLVNPWIVERGHFALPDGYLTFFTLLALWLAMTAQRLGRRAFSTAAVYSIMMAIVFKTQAIFVAPLVVLMPLLGLRNSVTTEARRNALQQTFWNCVRFSFFLFWLFLLYPTLEVDKVPNWVAPLDSLGDSLHDHIIAHLALTMRQFQTDVGWLATAICGLTLWRFRCESTRFALFAVLFSALALLIGTSLFGRQSLRQFYTLGALISLLYAAGLTGLISLFEEALTRLHSRASELSLRLRPLLPSGVVLAMLSISLVPAYRESDALVRNFALHDRRNDLMSYMDTSLPPGKYISERSGPFHKVSSRSWGGYAGRHDYPLAQSVKRLHSRPIDVWRAHDAVYAIVPYRSADGKPVLQFPKETFALKHFPTDPDFRDPGMTVLRLYPMQREADGQLGSIHLVGYDLNASEVAAGEDIIFRQYWRADKPTDTVHRVGNYLLNDDNEVVAQVDYVPLWDARRDTTTWDDPDEILIGREFTLSVPSDLPPATYQLSFGFYDSTSRLLSPEGSDLMELTEITVFPPEF